MSDQSHRAREIGAFEDEAEVLVACQLDLLAQLERQLRAVHKTMRDIEKLRVVRKRVGPELTNGEREDTLAHLSTAVADLDAHISMQHDCCTDMQATITRMRERVAALRRSVSSHPAAVEDPSSQGSEP
jgi:uncharacterized coiled-coil protein SlyX